MPGFIFLPLKFPITDLPTGPAVTLDELRQALTDAFNAIQIDYQAPAAPSAGTLPVVSGAPPTAIPRALDPRAYPITQRIGEQLTPFNGRPHAGVDYGMPEGAPVAALRHGRIIYAAWSDPMTGNLITIRYDDGVVAYFAHLSSVGASFVGQEVWPDTTVGFIGHTGAATGPHLHLELHSETGHLGTLDKVIDPITYFA